MSSQRAGNNTAPSFQCPICPKSFTRRNNLHTHCRVHTGIRPFKCPSCVEKFQQKHSLKRHIENRHNKKCCVCDAQVDAIDMADHFRANHPGKKMKKIGNRNFKCNCGHVCQDFTRHLAHVESCELILRNREIIKAVLPEADEQDAYALNDDSESKSAAPDTHADAVDSSSESSDDEQLPEMATHWEYHADYYYQFLVEEVYADILGK